MEQTVWAILEKGKTRNKFDEKWHGSLWQDIIWSQILSKIYFSSSGHFVHGWAERFEQAGLCKVHFCEICLKMTLQLTKWFCLIFCYLYLDFAAYAQVRQKWDWADLSALLFYLLQKSSTGLRPIARRVPIAETNNLFH